MRAFASAAAALLGATAARAYVLNLGPAKAPVASQSVYYNSSLWSWGGSVIETASDPQWRFHVFVATFINGCGLSAWEGNSQVLHGVANDPLGPFVFNDVAVPVWAHNPQVVLHPDGTYLLYSIGMDPESRVANCSADGGAPPPAGAPRSGHGRELMNLHVSTSVYGPWTLAISNIFNGTNPAPWVNPDGSVYVGSHTGSAFQVSYAPHWKGPYSAPLSLFGPNAGSPYVFEDPFLWFDTGAQVWRVLLHQYNSSDTRHQVRVGGVASSANASLTSAWTLQADGDPAYTTNVTFTDGTFTALSRRERPKLLLDGATGQPRVLYTGVCPADSGNNCFTLAQPVLGVSGA